ncbi:MAG: mandelate racemase/muconate lactonizing enzyme family protein [Alphaproteobacteria bacterium]|nr:mandelate racemase/muconate lactonizing enzyme family protein [Rhodospirillaceae bacterium]MDG2481895.1 mandelate racemase/muconate lactonizing enzyme family protein [Alphaproteobacteria bacterium]MBT6202523.1 mandelate racemase/muconate lactonizing enzyme family protein [Rhodospirillaceae bacterium]MBT6512742.1 mandelate racemase/muconate lactonizing enzyme family protein [Rhodospirillaceae bacterium]MBT7612842.1 mandelate racemase/muconate lactonizing enzyme family protein [Rhodospirillace
MKIVRIAAYGLELPFKEGSYRCRNRTEPGQTSTMVEITTDEGLTGWGEVAPLGAFYSEAFAGGVRAGLHVLAPELLGEDPREIHKLVHAMDGAMFGQMDAKTPIDIALWDLFSQAAGLPLAEALGGRCGAEVMLYRSISQDSPDVMEATARRHIDEGYQRLQVKVGDDPRTDAERLEQVAALAGPDVVLYCDANGAWTSQDALRFLDATRGIDYILEQPCASHEENLRVRRVSTKPMVLDESCDSLEALVRIHNDGAADGVTIKISRFGGITRARRVRDLAVDFGMMVTVECVGGAEIISAAIAHMSLSTPEERRAHTVDFHNWVTVSNAGGFPPVANGRMRAPEVPGLGVTPHRDRFGGPLMVFEHDA